MSLFLHSHVSLPGSWVETTSAIGQPIFRDSDTDGTTVIDPRHRGVPAEGHEHKARTRSPEYMAAYNAHPSTCGEYWGHRGRVWITKRRNIPPVFLALFLFSVMTLIYIGRTLIMMYASGLCKGANCHGTEASRVRRIEAILAFLNVTDPISFVIAGLFLSSSANGILAVVRNISKGPDGIEVNM